MKPYIVRNNKFLKYLKLPQKYKIHIIPTLNCEALPLELRTGDLEAPTPLKPGTSNSGAAILGNGMAILCDETAILCSEHSTAGLDLTSVTSSGQGYIRRATPEPGSMRELLLQQPDLPDLRRIQQQQPSGTPQLSAVEKEAIRWKGKPWLAPSPVRPSRPMWYILWTT